MGVASLQGATSAVAKSFESSQKDMATALARLGSQKRFQSVSQDSTAFIKANSLQSQQTTLESVQGSIQRGKGFLDVADGWATNMLDQLAQLKGALKAGETDKATGIAASITAAAAATYDGNALNVGATAFDSVNLSDGTALSLTLAGATAADYAALNTTGAVDTAVANLETYAGKIAEFKGTLDSQSSFVSDMIENTRSAANDITAIDDASEMAKFTDADIRNQASAAMMAQGNASQRSVTLLFR
jgi:flagellin-like hook-associated protein FlgL